MDSGKTLLSLYGGSLYKLLLAAYPEFQWEAHLFFRASAEQWNNVLQDQNKKIEYVNYLEKQLGITHQEQWNTVLSSQVRKLKLPPNWDFNDVVSLVRDVYKSELIKLKSAAYKKTQAVLKTSLKTLFPKEGQQSSNVSFTLLQRYWKNISIQI